MPKGLYKIESEIIETLMMFYKNNSFTKQMKKCLFNMIGLTEELELKVDFPLLHMDRKQAKMGSTLPLFLIFKSPEFISNNSKRF